MCNVLKNGALALLVLLSTACTDSNPGKKACDDMLQRIETMMQDGQDEQALALMDSIDKKYPSQIEARRKVTKMRPVAIESLTRAQIVSCDSALTFNQLEIQKLDPLFMHIDGGELEGYYVVADAYNKDFINSGGIEPRVNDTDFNFYITAQSRGRQIGIDHIVINAGADSQSSLSLPANTHRLMEIEGSELATFLPEEVDELGAWAWENGGAVDSYVLAGSKGQHKDKLAKGYAIGTAWKYAQLKKKQKALTDQRAKLERKLQIARDQIANTAIFDDNSTPNEN